MADSLNPISSKGRLSFAAFASSLAAFSILNLMAFVLIRSRLIPARVTLQEDKAMALYAVWLVFSILGFYCVTNLFLKRWAAILGDEKLSAWLRIVLRVGLLSPLFAYPLTLITFLFFPGSPVRSVENGGSRRSILMLLGVSFALSMMISLYVSRDVFGLERTEFRQSIENFASYGFKNGTNPIPRDIWMRPFMAAAPPATRYLTWIGTDFVRTKSLSLAVEDASDVLCQEKMGFAGIEVADCFFWNMRKIADVAPFISPVFGFYFESKYRQAHPPSMEMDDGVLQRSFATSMVTISNQLELIEMGPMFVSRVHLLKPTALLHAYGSPEIPLVEAGQDIQRYMLHRRIMPIIEMQLDAIREHLEKSSDRLGESELAMLKEFREIQARVAKVKRDPLMVAE